MYQQQSIKKVGGFRYPSISEGMCVFWQVLGFVVCISMYCGLFCGMYWHVLALYVLWNVLVCIVFGMYCKYWYVLACIDI